MIPALNLIAEPLKKELRRVKTLLLLHEALLFLFIIIAIGSVFLLGARVLLEQRYRQAVIEYTPGTAKITIINREITNINQRILRLNQISGAMEYKSPLILDLVKRTPAGVQWSSLTLNSDGTATLSGIANKRQNLVAFQDNLSDSPFIRGLHLPLRYLVPDENVVFTFQITTATANLKIPSYETF